MATHEELSKFRHSEIASLNLTHKDLNQLSFEQLLSLAEIRVKGIQPKTEKDSDLKTLLLSILAQISASVIAHSITSGDWIETLKSIVRFCQN